MFPHNLIIEKLRKRIGCVHLLKYIERILKAGYVDPKTKVVVKSNKGLPQGSPLSPILSNIILHEFDEYIMKELKPTFDKGVNRRYNPIYDKLQKIIRSSTKSEEEKILARLERNKYPAKDPLDPNFKRLMYVRYADDFVIFIIGHKSDAEDIKFKIGPVLEERCGSKLSIEKTIVSHIRDGFNFLGAHIKKLDNKVYRVKTKLGETSFSRKVPLKLFITAPILEIINKLIEDGFARRNKYNMLLAKGRKNLILMDMYTIISFYNSKINGILNFFSFAGNRSSLHRIFWIMRQSCALTLRLKYKLTSMKKAFDKFGFDLRDPETGIQLNIPKDLSVLHDYKKEAPNWEKVVKESRSNRLTIANQFTVCALCGSTQKVEHHHIRAVKDVRAKIRTGNASWAKIQGAFLRKQIPLCKYHHMELHKGNLSAFDIKKLSQYRKNDQ